MSEESNNNGSNGFETPFGISEEDFMRTVAQGDYTPTVHEIENLIIEDKITFIEARILLLIKKKTVNFRNTHVRVKRKELYEALALDRKRFHVSKQSLISKGYLLEKHHEDDYYWYALNPFKFNGVIVLRSKKEAFERLNRNEKLSRGLIHTRGKKPSQTWQKATDWVAKSHAEDYPTIQNYSAFETLKYTLLKYTLLNGLSDLTGQTVIKILEECRNAEYVMLQWVKLMHSQPVHSRGMVEELKRAHSQQKDCDGNPIRTNAAIYVISCWNAQAKQHWQSLPHKLDQSPEAIQFKNELYDVIQSYPLQNNVVDLRKAK